jgi:hypothetical protein
MDAPTAVGALLLEMRQGVCVECIAVKTGIALTSVQATFQRLAGVVRIIPFQGRCGVCSRRKEVTALARSPFLRGDLVTHRSHRDWIGAVIDTSGFENGYVSVRWHSASAYSATLAGMLPQAVEEPVKGLVLLQPVNGDSGQG